MSSQDGEKRQTKPVMRTTYTTLGNPTEAPALTGGSSGARSAPRTHQPPQGVSQVDYQVPGPSTRASPSCPSPQRKYSPTGSFAHSTSTLIELAEVDANEALLDLEDKHKDELEQLEEDLQLSKEEPNNEKETLKIQDKIDRIKATYNRKKSKIERQLDLAKRKITLISADQVFDKQEEKVISDWKPEVKPDPRLVSFDEKMFQRISESMRLSTNDDAYDTKWNTSAPPSPNTVAADREVQSILKNTDYVRSESTLPPADNSDSSSESETATNSRPAPPPATHCSSQQYTRGVQSQIQMSHSQHAGNFTNQIQSQAASSSRDLLPFPPPHGFQQVSLLPENRQQMSLIPAAGNHQEMVNDSQFQHAATNQFQNEATATSPHGLSVAPIHNFQQAARRQENSNQMSPTNTGQVGGYHIQPHPYQVLYQPQPTYQQPYQQEDYGHRYRTPRPPFPDPISALATALNQAIRGGSRADKKLPIFDGNPSDWCNFNAAYQRSFHRYDDAENMMRVQEALRGEAKITVAHLFTNPANISKLFSHLKKHFGRAELVIDDLIEQAKRSKAVDGSPEALVNFGRIVETLLQNITSFKMTSYLHDRQLVQELTKKLPKNLQVSWCDWLVADSNREKNLVEFEKWLTPKIDSALLRVKPASAKYSQPKPQRRQGVHVAETKETSPKPSSRSPKPKCTFCSIHGHEMVDCRKFRQQPIDEKWNFVHSHNLCRICFQQHHSKDCKKKKCQVDKCGKPHHSTLHREIKKPAEASGRPSSPTQSEINDRIEHLSRSSFSASGAHVAEKMGTLPVIQLYVEGNDGKRKKLYALLDSGADFSMVEESVAEELGLEGKRSTIHFSVFGGTKKEDSSQVSMKISGAFKDAPFYKLNEVHTVSKLGIGGITVDAERLKSQHPYLRRMKIKSIKNAVPQMLLGYSCYELFAAQQALECPQLEGPSAYRSRLGWYVKMASNNDFFSCHMAFGQHPDSLMHNDIKSFFSTESFGVTPIANSERSKENIQALKMLEQHTKKKGNRWETCLLWKNENVTLPDSQSMALKRLHSMEKKMEKDPEFADLVEKKFEDYIQKGYLQPKEKCDMDNTPSSKKWYLPWFFVKHPTKKPRLVFDAAAKVGEKSLNDFLLKGPDLLNPLPSVLMRFRRHRIALTADIREMFHQVALRKEDWPSQTILYRGKDRSKPPKEFYMTVLFFGSASSPCSAIYAKNKNAEEYRDKFPRAVEAIQEDFYMDDFLGGAETEEEALQLQQQLTEIHSSGGFDLVKWNSSSLKVLQAIPEQLRSEGSIGFEEKADLVSDKTLGLWWCPVTDEFSFKISFHRVPEEVSKCHKIPTKRQMTSIVMAVFDPLGFLSPLKVKALMLIQEVWRSGIGWDDEIPMNILESWKWWIGQVSLVKGIRVPRRLTTLADTTNVTLHTFCDASEEAFCSSVYAVFDSMSHSSPQCAFMFGKARVAPLKGLTIPKMELQAGLMGSRSAETVKKTIKNFLPITSSVYWSDSKSVLAQIRSNTLRYKAFEANRIGEILTLTNLDEWKWVPTALNVADDGTRFSSPCDLSSSSRWLTGPQFILQKKEDWPEEPQAGQTIPAEDLGVKVLSSATRNVTGELTFSRCGTWSKLIRSNARVIKYIHVLKYRANLKLAAKHNSPVTVEKPKPYVTYEEQERAKKWLIKQAQEESFAEELKALRAGDSIKKQSKLYCLSPAIDEEGVLVLQGRIENAPDASRNIQFPPILDSNHTFTKLLIEWIHQSCGHQGQEQALHKLRKEAWVIGARSAVRRCWFHCFECKKARGQPNLPAMGQLPLSRLGESHVPFHHTGVDFFGPYNVTFGRKTLKRWGVIFTCLSTRAVHLELADSLDISAFVKCFVRFKSVRGKPSHIWSDNGTNFVGTNREFKESLKEFQRSAPEAMEAKGIRWHFNPPSAPHMGGSWERLVGSVKKILARLLKETNPRESTLRTLFAEITEILNDRPLCHVSADPDDPECLTPNHFLRLKNAPEQSVPGKYTTADKYQKAWRHGQFLADQFWKRWVEEYLPTLAKREKWLSPAKPLEVGDLVLVINDLIPRSAWKKGLITATYPAADGQVRKVDVRVAHVDPGDKKKAATISIYHRPAVKVCPLGIKDIVPGVTGRENVSAEEMDRMKTTI